MAMKPTEYFLIDLDEEERRLQPYRNADGGMSTPAASRQKMLALIHEHRHLRRYVMDAESGNAALRAENERLRDGLEQVGLLIDGQEFIPMDIVNKHMPFAPPPDTKVEAVFTVAWR